MKSFLRTLIAVLLADLLIVLILVVVVATKAKETPKIESGSVLIQSIDGSLPEYTEPGGLPGFGSTTMTHTMLLENLEKARRDKRIRAVVLKLGSPSIGYGKMEEMRDRIDDLRRAGKPVIGYTEFLTNRAIYLGSSCDSLYLMRNGYVSLSGFATERSFIKGTLEKLGIKDNIHRIEKYKSAAEILQRKDLSPESRANVEWIIDTYYPNFLRTVEEGRGLGPGTLESQVLSRPAMVPREALEAGLVDRLLYWDELESTLLRLPGVKAARKTPKGLDPRPRMVTGQSYAKVERDEVGIRPKKTIAIVHAQGTIAGERSGVVFPVGTTMGAATMEEAFREALSNKKVEAIVFRVDSGGGESSTSWRIGRAAERASRVKPVVVSMVDLAASGAYTISYPCSTLVAGRLSVVGSIGSISGKFNMRGFYDKLGMTKDFVTRGPHALMESDYFDYSPEEYAEFARRHWEDYYEWVDDIAAKRGFTRAQIDSVGRGRVWTGEQAILHGLIDTLGGFDTAVEIAKKKAGIPASEEVAFVHYPKAPGPLEALRQGGFSFAILRILDSATALFRREATWAIDWESYW